MIDHRNTQRLHNAWSRTSANQGLALVAMLCGMVAGEGHATGQGTLEWSDEFSGTTLNAANWEPMIGTGTSYGLPAGWGNNELQYYTDRAVNVSVSDGKLHIVAIQESFGGSSYTSARLRTLNLQEFLYGRLEARIKLPATTGIWPAFWMLPTGSPYGGWAASGEIDIVESVNDATTIHGTLHFGGQWPANTSAGGTYVPGASSNGFRTYSIEWEPDAFRWYVDGVQYHSEASSAWYSENAPGNPRAPFDTDFHFLLNVAVGGNFPGSPDGSSTFPQEMLVDWVRVYDSEPVVQTPLFGSPTPLPGRVEAEFYDIGGESVAYHDCDASNNGGIYRPGEGVDTESSSEGGFNVGWMCADEWIEYTVDVGVAGAYRIESRVASQSTGGSLHIEFDGVDKTGNIAVPVTGGWQTWTTVSAVAQLDAGEQIMRFVNGSGSGEYNLNYFDVVELDPADLDLDGDVDDADYAIIAGCMEGPNVTIPPGGCTQAEFDASDLENDSDVDLSDFAEFSKAFGS